MDSTRAAASPRGEPAPLVRAVVSLLQHQQGLPGPPGDGLSACCKRGSFSKVCPADPEVCAAGAAAPPARGASAGAAHDARRPIETEDDGYLNRRARQKWGVVRSLVTGPIAMEAEAAIRSSGRYGSQARHGQGGLRFAIMNFKASAPTARPPLFPGHLVCATPHHPPHHLQSLAAGARAVPAPPLPQAAKIDYIRKRLNGVWFRYDQEKRGSRCGAAPPAAASHLAASSRSSPTIAHQGPARLPLI